MKARNMVLGLGAAGVVLALTACDPTDSQSQPFNDASVDKSQGKSGVQAGPAVLVNMPDGFNNIAYKCVRNPDGTWTMFSTLYHSTSAYGAVAVTEHAALCGKGE
jgi:hypothetical protein